MKFISTAILYSGFAFLIISCSGSDTENQVQPQYQVKNGWAQFRIDNVVWEAPATISMSTGMLTAQRGNELLQIKLVSDSPGTYNLTTSPSSFVGINQHAGRDYYSYSCSPAGGRLVISENDGTYLSGTFNAKICTSDGQSKELTNAIFTRVLMQ